MTDETVAVEQCDRERIKAISYRLLERMRYVARRDGWALAVHGSMSRDLDLIAVPWTDEATDEAALVEAMRAAVACVLGGVAIVGAGEDGRTPGVKMKPNGRRCYTLHSTSEQLIESESGAHPYIDLSVMDFRIAAFSHPRPALDREAVAKAIASRTYAFPFVTEQGSYEYDCGRWEEMGSDAQGTYLEAADKVIALATPPARLPGESNGRGEHDVS